MKITKNIHQLIVGLTIGGTGEEKKEKKERLTTLLKIFNLATPTKNPSTVINRLNGRTLTYKQSEKVIEWFGSHVYFLKDDKGVKIAIGEVDGEIKAFAVYCRIGSTFFDALNRGVEFDNLDDVKFKEFDIKESFE